MADTNDENPKPRQPIPLSYETPDFAKRPAGGMPYAVQMLIGFVAFPAFIVAGFALGLATNSLGSAFGGAVAGVIGLVVLSILAHTRLRWRGFLVGVLIAIGLGCLAAGICFAYFVNW